MEKLEQIEKRIREESEIKCPQCGYIQSADDGAYPVSYHGNEDGPVEWICQKCDETFYVREIVRRSYDVEINQDDL